LEKLNGGGGGGGFTGLATTAASPQFTTEIYNSVKKNVVRNWDGPDAKDFAGIYKSNWVCSAVQKVFYFFIHILRLGKILRA
jgi:hypothetical protein